MGWKSNPTFNPSLNPFEFNGWTSFNSCETNVAFDTSDIYTRSNDQLTNDRPMTIQRLVPVLPLLTGFSRGQGDETSFRVRVFLLDDIFETDGRPIDLQADPKIQVSVHC